MIKLIAMSPAVRITCSGGELAMTEPENHPEARVALFQSREIRRTLHNDEWWLVITYIVAALADVADPSDYWKKMRRRDPDLSLDSHGGTSAMNSAL